MMDEENRSDLIVCGRKIGTFLAWDDLGYMEAMFAGFEPVEAVAPVLRPGIIQVNYDEGTLSQDHDDNGHPAVTHDLVELLSKLPKEPPATT